LLVGVALAIPAIVFAEGEHSRRAGSELLVLLGDIGKLKSEDLSDKQRRGLHDRIAGSFSALPLLLRLANQEQGRYRTLPDFNRLRLLLVDNALPELVREISGLSAVYPFQGTGILSARASAARVRNALQLHQTLCAACHDFPYLDTERPAFNLYGQAKNLAEREFAARMVVGVRGDTTTGLGNPFTDEEIAAFIMLYRSMESTAEAVDELKTAIN